MTRIKICGITEIETGMVAAEAGADYLGLVFAQSSRQINPKTAAGIVHAVKNRVENPQMVGVFVNAAEIDVNFIAESCHLDLVQLSGKENWEYCTRIKKPVIKTIHIYNHSTVIEILEEIKKGFTFLSPDHLKILLDTKIKGVYGGTGKPFDWKIAREISLKYPVFVAGGLGPENIVQMLSEVNPWGVDVSSGVETGGKKDLEKMRLFIQKVRSTG
jgi:phosphoribosylanthranilate isomerase